MGHGRGGEKRDRDTERERERERKSELSEGAGERLLKRISVPTPSSSGLSCFLYGSTVRRARNERERYMDGEREQE